MDHDDSVVIRPELRNAIQSLSEMMASYPDGGAASGTPVTNVDNAEGAGATSDPETLRRSIQMFQQQLKETTLMLRQVQNIKAATFSTFKGEADSIDNVEVRRRNVMRGDLDCDQDSAMGGSVSTLTDTATGGAVGEVDADKLTVDDLNNALSQLDTEDELAVHYNYDADDNSDFSDDEFGDVFVRPRILQAVSLPDIERTNECQICYELKNTTARPCCNLELCVECMALYLSSQITSANLKIRCPSNKCDKIISREEVLYLLREDVELKQKYNRFLVDANQEPHRKTCPRCSHITEVDPKSLNDQPKKVKKFGMQVTCVECQLDWCFSCHAPWHDSISCKEYRRGDKLVKSWAKRRDEGQINAQHCPKCRVLIQRNDGCDHMTCSRCSTDFCYLCGEKYRGLKYLGNHHSRLSIFGCKYKYMPDQPVRRKLTRGAIFGGKVLGVTVAAPIAAGVAVGAVGLAAGLAVVALPAYGVYRLVRKVRSNRQRRRQAIRMLNDVENVETSSIAIRVTSLIEELESAGDDPERIARIHREIEEALNGIPEHLETVMMTLRL